MIVSCIVEGDGEIEALPVLLRRIRDWKTPDAQVQIQRPVRLPRGKILKCERDLERHLILAAEKCLQNGWILIVFDSDNACPKELAERIRTFASTVVAHRRVSVVIPHCEFEAWFIAAYNRTEATSANNVDPERIRDAKGWVAQHTLGGAYREVLDQPKLSAKMDLETALVHSRSFRKLCKDWIENVAPELNPSPDIEPT